LLLSERFHNRLPSAAPECQVDPWPAGLPISVKGDESRYDTLPIQYGLIRFKGTTEYWWTSMALIDCPAETPDEATPEPTPPAKKKKGR
jgi:hypothetical protein